MSKSKLQKATILDITLYIVCMACCLFSIL